jgi:Site-specific recombinase XerD
VKGSVFKRCPCGVTGGGGKRPPACKKPHGTWSYVVDLPPTDGRRRQEKRGGFRDRAEAEEALAAVLKGLADGTYAHDERKTVGAFLDEWLAAKIKAGLRPTTARSYRQHITDYLRPHLGKIRLRDLRPGHISAMLGKVAEAGPAPATVRRVHATLRSALTSAVRQQLIAFNVAANVDLPAAPRPKVRPWEPAELGKFLDHATADPRFGALFELVAATGLRRGEAVGLRWDDVDLAAGVLTVRQQLVQVNLPVDELPPCPYCSERHRGMMFGPPKTASGEARRIELDTTTVGMLLAHQVQQQAEREEWGIAYADHGLVFAREDGNPLALDAVTKRFRELAKEAGVRPVRLHDLRHGAASLRLAAGADIAVVSKVLGHSSVSITSDTYSHLLEGVGRAAAERAAALVPRNRRDQLVTSDARTAAPDLSETAVSAGDAGAPPGTRTPNPRIKSPLLCQLS